MIPCYASLRYADCIYGLRNRSTCFLPVLPDRFSACSYHIPSSVLVNFLPYSVECFCQVFANSKKFLPSSYQFKKNLAKFLLIQKFSSQVFANSKKFLPSSCQRKKILPSFCQFNNSSAISKQFPPSRRY